MSADLVALPTLTYLEGRLLAYRPETRDPVRFDLSPSTIEDHVWQDHNAYYCRTMSYFRRHSWGENYTTLHIARRCRKIEDEHKGLGTSLHCVPVYLHQRYCELKKHERVAFQSVKGFWMITTTALDGFVASCLKREFMIYCPHIVKESTGRHRDHHYCSLDPTARSVCCHECRWSEIVAFCGWNGLPVPDLGEACSEDFRGEWPNFFYV